MYVQRLQMYSINQQTYNLEKSLKLGNDLIRLVLKEKNNVLFTKWREALVLMPLAEKENYFYTMINVRILKK